MKIAPITGRTSYFSPKVIQNNVFLNFAKNNTDIFVKSPVNIGLSFRGKPQEMPKRTILSADDAIAQWELCKSAKYFDVHDDPIYSYYKNIRLENYAFLDELTSPSDKAKFIEHFKKTTNFPDLHLASMLMREHFAKTIENISGSLNNQYQTNDFNVLFWGFDPTSSVGQSKAFPGSDLDKACIVIAGDYMPAADYNTQDLVKQNDCSLSEQDMVNLFKGKIWETLDQRLVSVNHPDTFPEVITLKQLSDRLTFLDKKAQELVDEKGEEYYESFKKSDIIDPFRGARFNIDLAKKLSRHSYDCTREEAKNFAFLIEALRENGGVKAVLRNGSIGDFFLIKEGCCPDMFYAGTYGDTPLSNPSLRQQAYILNLCLNSPFVRFSNVTQIDALIKRNGEGGNKQKIKNRKALEEGLYENKQPTNGQLFKKTLLAGMLGTVPKLEKIQIEKPFSEWSIDEQYELVKDIIKASSNDQSSKFDKYFKNDEDIKAKYDPLIAALTE